MTVIAEPRHARLPLWADKTTDQKAEVLIEAAEDFARLAGAVPGSIFAGTDLDAAWEALRERFRHDLGDQRQELILDLTSVAGADDCERNSIRRAITLLEREPRVLWPGCETGHVTGSALIVSVRTRRVLLHRHKKLNRWFQFGGHPDFETDMLRVARREAVEESGITGLKLLTPYERARTPVDVDLQHIPEGKGRPSHLHLDYRYVFDAPILAPVVDLPAESGEFWTLDFDEAQRQPDDVIEPSVKRLIAKARLLVEDAAGSLSGSVRVDAY